MRGGLSWRGRLFSRKKGKESRKNKGLEGKERIEGEEKGNACFLREEGRESYRKDVDKTK